MKDIDKLVKAYVACRDDLAVQNKAFALVTKKHKEAMAMIEDKIMQLCVEQKVESFKTAHGTAFKTKKDFVKVADWSAALSFIIDNDLRHMLTKSVAKAAAKEYMEENNNELPPGLEYGTVAAISVRRK